MGSLFKIESFHDDHRGAVNPKYETFVRSETSVRARAYVARLFGVTAEEVLLSKHDGQPPVDSMVINAV